jgi:iron complex outermembrane receptor protein/vitamin B12 transporter
VRRNASSVGQPNAFDLYGIADDSQLKEQNTLVGGTLQNQTTTRWHNLIRYGATRLTLQSVNPSPSGIPFDPFGFGPNFIGKPVTLCGPGGCAPPGQAILDFGGTFPSKFDSMTNRDFLQTQSDYRLNSHLTALFGFRYENERGGTHSAFSNGKTERDNFSYTIQGQGDLFHRLYTTAGVGLEKNAIFGFAATPRVSLAYYVVRPSSDTVFSGTKLKFNFGKGIKEPSIFDETSSLFAVLTQSAPQLVSQFHLVPAGPERSRSFDFGFDQALFGRRARVAATFFHNRFYDQIEFVDKTLLPGIGVPVAAANALAFGASVNSLDYRARGAETEIEVDLSHGISAKGTYTYTGAVVEKSFSSDNQFPSFNPAFPTTPIGAFSPLIGARPFRIAPHVGTFSISYERKRLFADVTGYLSSRRDDSTFLTDSFFGTSLLLPNRNLADAYQKLDLHVSYKVHPAITIFGTAENLLNQRYDAAYGFPSLPFTVRAGMKFTIGGEGWKPKP